MKRNQILFFEVVKSTCVITSKSLMGVDGKMKQKSEFILLKDDILKQALNEKEKVIDKGFYADLYQTTL